MYRLTSIKQKTNAICFQYYAVEQSVQNDEAKRYFNDVVYGSVYDAMHWQKGGISKKIAGIIKELGG